MPRELSAPVTAVKDAPRFSYYDTAEIQLPFGPGDTSLRVLHISTAPIEVIASFDFTAFTYTAFAGALDRVPTSTEQTTWITALETAFETSQAALLAEAQDLVGDLFDSAEYAARMRNDSQFVSDLYHAFLGRVPDAVGLGNWLDDLTGGATRAHVRDGFKNSAEFATRVARLHAPLEMDPDGREWGDLIFADGAAIDGVDFALTNLDNGYSDIVGQSGRRLYPAPAVVSRAFRVADGTYESVEMARGFAKFSAVDGGSARVTIVSDLSRRGVDMVVIDSQHCINVYKGDGCDSTDPSPTCSRLLNDAVNGCASKDPAPQIEDTAPPDNRPSFRGTPQLAPTPTTGTGIDPDDTGPGGWPPNDYDPDEPRRRGRPIETFNLP